jgi:uncharacterized membrane protein YhaH (DUF805 family)
MSFQDSVRTVLTQKFATFDGRARRSEFWWFALFTTIVQVIASIIDRAILGADSQVGVVAGIAWLALIVPSLAVGARRLHDTGRSGWWQLLSLIPLVGTIILIIWWAKDGDAAPNQHGINPKTTDAVTNVVGA